jgi:transposase
LSCGNELPFHSSWKEEIIRVVDPNLLQKYEITEEDIRNTPPRVLSLLAALLEEVAFLRKRVEELEARLNKDSSNSSKPPSSDKPFKKKPPGEKKGKAGGKHGHKGHRQALIDPTEVRELKPETCSSCGSKSFIDFTSYYTHQLIELPEIKPDVLHLILYKGKCAGCGKTNKALVPHEHRSGYGPNLSAVMAEFAGSHGNSRSTVKSFCSSVLGFHISLGAIQKVIDRVSEAITKKSA